MQKHMDQETMQVIVESLHAANVREVVHNAMIKGLTEEIKVMNEDNARLTKQKATLENDVAQLNRDVQYVSKMSESTLSKMKELIPSDEYVNTVVREFFAYYGNAATLEDSTVVLKLGTLKDVDYGVKFTPLREKTTDGKQQYKLATYLNKKCLHVEKYGYPCGGKTVYSMEETHKNIAELRNVLPNFFNDENCKNLVDDSKKDDRDQFMELLRSMFEKAVNELSNELSDDSDSSSDSDSEEHSNND